ncbi:Ail/Lom family outer membrane beta-barrel protein [Escherichia coli]|uniref:Ail/Lom family outer membrane beta-barrel protein n=1 Tax=Escherichia coli TaxID=562 RepID=UPI00187D19B6|nr:Ail/Lom family outer membrane beta-barrel protein [Escherichia coli]MBE7930393.1 Ail/Lom family outer membrane beta-barrel protein [Escherichia coli]
MRKCYTAMLCALAALFLGGMAMASGPQTTLSAGWLHARTQVSESDNLNGINVKYRYEFTDSVGLVSSFSYANVQHIKNQRHDADRWHEDSLRHRGFSVMAGPSLRMTEWFSAYVLAGVSYARESSFAGDYVTLMSDEGKKQDHLTDSASGHRSHTSLAYGMGIQINPAENIAIDMAYETAGRGDWRTDAFIVGIGYRF